MNRHDRANRTTSGHGLTRREALGRLAGGAGFAALGGCAVTGARADRDAVFTSGVASGDPEASALVIWTRAAPEGAERTLPVAFEVAEDSSFARIVRQGAALTSATRDFTVKIDVQGLRPGQTYHYRFRAGRALSPAGRGRTLPLDADRVTLALASCSNYPSGFYNAYREIAAIPDLDAVVHVGDYIYEYGANGYDAASGRMLGRVHAPAHDIVTLDDYRRRFAQYRADPDLQAAHASAAFIAIWDDHETANNSWHGGAANHDKDTQGAWEARRDAALQAYFEWMPMRDPEPGEPAKRLRRVYDFGDVASLILIESRLTGRGQPLDYDDDLPWLAEAADASDPRIRHFMDIVRADPSRSMLGAAQEAWLADALMASRARGAAWQILGNQTVMARMDAPDLLSLLPPQIVEETLQRGGYSARWLARTRFGLPVNLDSWDGFPAARERLYDAARAAGANLAVLSGDSHMFWANNLRHPRDGALAGVEFATAGITSPGGYENFGGDPVVFDTAEQAMAAHNEDIGFANVRDRGFITITATRSAIRADYMKVSTVHAREYEPSCFLSVEAELSPEGQISGPLRRVAPPQAAAEPAPQPVRSGERV